jgi:hypothetical protein
VKHLLSFMSFAEGADCAITDEDPMATS